MKVTHINFDTDRHPPLLTMIIHGAPHRRQDRRVLQAYRICLLFAIRRIGIFEPIDYPIDVDLTLIDPTSPDLGNLYLAFEAAVDGKTLKGPTLLTDDRHIHRMTVAKLFIADAVKPSTARMLEVA